MCMCMHMHMHMHTHMHIDIDMCMHMYAASAHHPPSSTCRRLGTQSDDSREAMAWYSNPNPNP